LSGQAALFLVGVSIARLFGFGNASTTSPALGIFEPSNTANYTFPVTPTYAIHIWMYEGFQTAQAQTAWSTWY